mgnify:CR=1 FL=1
MNCIQKELYRKANEAIVKVTGNIEKDFHFNTAVAHIMELMNAVEDSQISSDSSEQSRTVYRHTVETIILLLSPFAPHL